MAMENSRFVHHFPIIEASFIGHFPVSHGGLPEDWKNQPDNSPNSDRSFYHIYRYLIDQTPVDSVDAPIPNWMIIMTISNVASRPLLDY